MKNKSGLNGSNSFQSRSLPLSFFRKLLMSVKVYFLISFIMGCQLRAETFSQTLTLKSNSISLENVFKHIEKESKYVVLYDYKGFKRVAPVSVNIVNVSLPIFLERLLKDLPYSYIIEDKTVLISAKKSAEPAKSVSSTQNVPIENLQQRVIGVVRGETGEPLEGVSVLEKGTQNGTSTGEDGQFNLQVTTGTPILQFTLVGYQSQDAAVGNRNSVSVSLVPVVSDLDEVVVVGYGVQKKVNLTGSVSVVKGDDLTNRPVGQTSAALQGTVPGLTVTQQSGQPGRDGGNLLIRGVGTLGSGTGPLVLVDGVETNINNVNPNDIESISVLKDASSAAIYGSRAAGGVILVTTRRAAKEGVNISYNNYAGWQVPTDMTDNVNGLDHMNLINEAYTNTGRSPLYTQAVLDEYIAGRLINPDRYADTDWQGLTMKKNSFMHSHHVGISAASEKVKVLGSLGYINQQGIIANTDFKRYNFRLNTDVKISEKWSAAMDLFLMRSDLKEPTGGTPAVFHWMRRIPANQAGLFSNGQYGEGWNGDNPIAKAKDGGVNQIQPINTVVNLDLKYKPTEWLTANLVYSPKFEISHSKAFAEVVQTYNWDGSLSYATPKKNSLTERYNQYWYNNLRAVLTFDKVVGDGHHFTALAGYQQEDQRDDVLSAYREMFLLSQFQEIDAGNKEAERTGGSATHWALRSFFGRFNYNYQEKYLFEANARYDGSSRFAKGNRYSFFPSFSAGWRITQEPFMQSVGHILTDMKLRASWGKLGNQNIGLYPFAAFVGIGNSNYTFDDKIFTGAALTTMANSEIRWETTAVSDVGIDVNLWSKFNISADYFYRKTTDILLQLDIPKSIGLGAPYQNAGVVENKGWDLSVGYTDRTRDFKYAVTVNMSDVKNKVLDMRGVARTGLQVNHEGYPISSLYGYEALGLFKDADDVKNHATQFGNVAAGDIKYKDQNGDGKINSDDEIIMGSHIPRYTYSANIDLAYKGFDFSLFLQGVGKADGYLYGQGVMPFYQGGTVQEQHKDRWTADNPNASFPRFAFNETNNTQNSTFWMKKASYLRVKNVQLGYTVPMPSQMQAHIQQLRLFVSGQNLFTSSKFWKGYDPEGPVGAGNWYPQMKVYTVGVNVKF